MSSLMQLTDELKQLVEWAEDPETDPQVLNDTMESVTAEIRGKVDACNVVLARLEAREDMITKTIEMLKKDRDRVKANKENFRNYIMRSMDNIGERRLTGDIYKLFIKKNGGKQVIDIFGEVPDNYKKTVTTIEVDKDKIRADLEDGKELTFAKFLQRGEHLEGDWTKLRKITEK